MSPPEGRRVGLVLSGGGALGAFEAGVVEVALEAGLAVDVYSGTSAGALNAAALAAGLTGRDLVDVWLRIDARDVIRPRTDLGELVRFDGLRGPGGVLERLLDTVGWTYLFRTGPLRRTIVEVLGGDTVDVAAGRTLVVTAVDLADGLVTHFANALPEPPRDTSRFVEAAIGADALLASAAIPLLFEPGEVAGRPYWDGGLLANTPLAPALAYDLDAALVVTTSTLPRPAPAPEALGQAISLVVDTVLGNSLRADLAHARTVNRLCDVDPAETRTRVDLLLVEPTGLPLGDALDFSPDAAHRRVAAGRRLAQEQVLPWLGRLGSS